MPAENINDISVEIGLALGAMTVDTIKETFNIVMDKIRIKIVANKAQEVLQKVREGSNAETIKKPELSAADEIQKYKELLDLGAITEEEFQFKKKELLGL